MDRYDEPREGAASPTRDPRWDIPHADRSLPLRDPELLGERWAALEPRLTRVALRYTRDPEAARDVVQSAFEKVLRHGDGFRGQSRASTWIHRIVVNEALMWLRTRRRRREDPPEAAPGGLALAADPTPDPCEILVRREQVERLRRGLRHLSDDERDLVRCCALEGESYAAYGRRRGLGVGAVKTRAFRARQRLAEAVSKA